jgi:inosine-uridine nucleoside N-ribohydrolase
MTLYHIDTDMGVDDGLALLVASRIPGAQIVAVSTVFGNVPIQVATRNARLFQHLLLDQQPFDVFMGAERASDGFSPSAIEAFGADGFGLATSDFAQELAAIDRAPPARPIPEATRPVTLIGIGPATNLPKLASYYGKNNVARIILMSGCFFDVGNQDNAGGFNSPVHRNLKVGEGDKNLLR